MSAAEVRSGRHFSLKEMETLGQPLSNTKMVFLCQEGTSLWKRWKRTRVTSYLLPIFSLRQEGTSLWKRWKLPLRGIPTYMLLIYVRKALLSERDGNRIECLKQCQSFLVMSGRHFSLKEMETFLFWKLHQMISIDCQEGTSLWKRWKQQLHR